MWYWANDPDTRRNSFESDPIPWAVHEAWWEKHQKHLQVGWLPVGVVRLEDGEISVNVAPSLRGQGYGTEIIRAAVLPNTLARIKETNAPSLRAFKSARFVEISRADGVVEMVYPGLH